MELAIVLGVLGFESAEKSRLNSLLPQVNCNGSTAFRDAVMKGNMLMIQLLGLFCKEGINQKFKFVHVVLTDGEDNSSKVTLQEFLGFQQYLQEKLPENILQTFYIGVNVENNNTVKQEMQAILQYSGRSAQYYPISSNDINDIFQKIQMQIGIRVQEQGLIIGNNQAAIALKRQTYQPVVQMQINNYIVLFTLDVSSSMKNDWHKVCSAVRGFLRTLGSNDLVLGIVFNNEVQVLTAIEQQKKTNNTQAKPQVQQQQKQQYQAPPQRTYQQPQVDYSRRQSTKQDCCQLI